MENIYANPTTGENNGTAWTDLTASTGKTSEVDYYSLAPYRASVTLWQVCSPVILVLGTFGNAMTLLVLRTLPMGTGSLSVFFSALAASDLLLLYTGLLRRWLWSVARVEVRHVHDVVCRLHLFLVYLCGMTSAWFLVAMTLQRVTSVLWPHRVALLCTRRKSLALVALLTLFLAALNAPILATYSLLTRPDHAADCALVEDPRLEFFDTVVLPWLDLVITSLLPSLLLVLGNSALTLTLYNSVKRARRMTTPRVGAASREAAMSSLTLTLICVSVTYLCLTLPVCGYLIVVDYVVVDSLYFEAQLELVWTISNLLWYLNSAINFYLYCLTGSKFRSQCRRLLLRLARRDARAVSGPGSVTTKSDGQSRSAALQGREGGEGGEDF